MKVGLVGEAPVDTLTLKILMSKKYIDFSFVELLRNKVTGSVLDNEKTKTALRLECISHKPDIVIFIRDLDGLDTKHFREEKLKKLQYYRKIRGSTLVKKTAFLLNVWEIEALLLADISAFNKFYGCDVTFKSDPTQIEQPKEYLYKLHRKYSNAHNHKIVEHSDFDSIRANCDYFDKFILEFDNLISK